MGETICNFFTRKVAYLKNIPYLCSPISSPRMNALSDTLYYALQNLEAQMVMQHNARVGWSCRRIVRAGVDVAGMMLGDDEVEEHRDAYLSMVCKRMSGDTRETIITLIMMAALFNLMPTDRQAKRCKAALSNNWADEIDDIYRAYCKAVDKQIDCQMEKQPSYTFTITVMKTEQPQTIINVAGNYIAQQNIDIHDNPHATIYATAPQDVPTKQASAVEREDATQAEYFCRITEAAISAGKALQIDDELRSAAVSAPKLIKAIRTNEALGYLDTKNLSSTELYNLLNEHYELTFKLRNFSRYREQN